MDTGRLGDVRRHENSNRKFMCILNNMIKSRWEIVDDSLSRERNEADIRLEKAGTLWRRKHVQQRVLLQCLKMRKETLAHSSARRYGSYGGKPLGAFSRDMDRFISDNHPKKRRQRKVKRALLESIERGQIIAPEDIPKKVERYFNSWKEKKDSSKHTNFLLNFESGGKTFKNKAIPPIRGLLNSFHKFSLDESEEESVPKVKPQTGSLQAVGLQTEDQELVRPTPEDQGMVAAQSGSTEPLATHGNNDRRELKPPKVQGDRKVLKLPPVQTTKAMISVKQT